MAAVLLNCNKNSMNVKFSFNEFNVPILFEKERKKEKRLIKIIKN